MHTIKNHVLDTPYHYLTTNVMPETERRFVHGKGAIVTDDMGKPYIDLSSSNLNMSFGHQHPNITRAVTEQMNKIWCAASEFNNPAFIELSKLLIKVSPEGLSAVNVRSCNGGDAVENAIKIARNHTRRKKILCARHAWHGESIATLGLSSVRAYHRVGYQPDVLFAEKETLESLTELVEAHRDAAAVVLDPLGVAPGLYEPLTLKQNLFNIRNLCTKYGVILIFDEIQTFGGYMGDELFASSHFDVTPDIICIGKALGAGIPISATLCHDFLRAVTLVNEGEYTYGGQPLGCAAGAEVIRTFQSSRKEVSENLSHFENAAQKLQQEFQSSQLRIRQIGFFVTIARKDGKFAENWVKRVGQKCLEQGLLVRKNHGINILIKPPVIISSNVIEDCFQKIAVILHEVEIEFQKPSVLYSDLLQNGEKPSLLTRIRKKLPLSNQWEYAGALLAEISPSLSVNKVDADQQEVNIRLLRRAGIPAVEVCKSVEGYLEYIYQPGVPMDKFMQNEAHDLATINGLVLLHQRYVEMAHDAGLSIPDRCPGNAIVNGMSLSLIDFDQVYRSNDDDKDILFAIEEVFSAFQCITWINAASLQQDLSNRLCLAVVDRYGALVSTVWSGMKRFYSNPSKHFLSESLTHEDYIRAIEVMSTSLSKSFQTMYNGS